MNTEKILEIVQRLAEKPQERIAYEACPDYSYKDVIDERVSDAIKKAGYGLADIVDTVHEEITEMLFDVEDGERRYFTERVIETYETEVAYEDGEEEDLDYVEVYELIWETEDYIIDTSEFYNYAMDQSEIQCWIAPGQYELFNLEGGDLIEREDDEDARWFEPFDLLLKQQGYSAFDPESKLCRSLEEEADNATYTYGLFLVVLARVTLRQLETLHQKGSGEFCARAGEAVVGLFDPGKGGGSVLGVELERDWLFTATSGEVVPDGSYGYGVDETYGIIESCFGGCEMTN